MTVISSPKAVRPNTVYGYFKRSVELAVGAYQFSPTTMFTALRLVNVAGSQGAVVDTVRQQMEKQLQGEQAPIQKPGYPISRYFSTIDESVQAVLYTLVHGRHGEIVYFDPGEANDIAHVIDRIIEMHRSESTAEGQRPPDFQVATFQKDDASWWERWWSKDRDSRWADEERPTRRTKHPFRFIQPIPSMTKERFHKVFDQLLFDIEALAVGRRGEIEDTKEMIRLVRDALLQLEPLEENLSAIRAADGGFRDVPVEGFSSFAAHAATAPLLDRIHAPAAILFP